MFSKNGHPIYLKKSRKDVMKEFEKRLRKKKEKEEQKAQEMS